MLGAFLQQLLRGKAINNTYIVCVRVAFVIQHEMRTRLSGISGLTAHYRNFPHYLLKRHNIRKNVNEHRWYVLISSTIFVRNYSHSKKN